MRRAVAGDYHAEIWVGAFLGFSYGFRPGRSQHGALDALCRDQAEESELDSRCRRSWFFRYLIARMDGQGHRASHRRRILRLIRKWPRGSLRGR